ncbi:hypothetical protein [Bacillus thuringiensis]|uniref:Uncharacterized protein n=4 Tax=Bacillus thuringiensis TaxID=1428 RepID=W8YH35_BACTU|nr:hypothetical protein [Bacillus thuringiensis]MBH0354819.1 hypothetical protein [Bacillus thuringiensis]CDN37751.1 unnamed protein product [Bacillus thuringiensis DB27]
MKKLTKFLTATFVMILLFTGFNVSSASALYDGQVYNQGYNTYLYVGSTKTLHSNPNGGTVLGAIAPQSVSIGGSYNSARILIKSYKGLTWLHYTNYTELNNDLKYLNWANRTLQVQRTQDIYSTALGSTKMGAIAPQTVEVVGVSFNISSYVGQAWLQYGRTWV